MAWWYSQDEERWNGPEETREIAIAEGRGEYGGEAFMVCEAETGTYDMALTAAQIFDILESRNEDRGDPEGDPPFTRVTVAQRKALEAKVNGAIADWVRENAIDVKAYMFEHQSPAETIPENFEEETP